MIDQQAKDAFWGVVEDCLVEIHHTPRWQAQALVKDLRKKIEQPPAGLQGDIIYHDEPFDVACDLAGNSLGLSPYRQKYETILSQHNW
jgi:metal-sulfur cluster biosynthetic enzyme